MKSIFEYDDHHDYIKDALLEKNITASRVALKLNLKSKSYLGMILRGKKRLQPEQIHIFKDLFEMSTPEFEYFFNLVFFKDSKSSAAQNYHKKKLDILRKTNLPAVRTESGKEEVLTQWYYPALLLYTTLKKKIPLKALSNSLGIAVSELEFALQDLQKLGLLKINENDLAPKLKVAKKSWSLIQRRFLKNQIKNALDTFDKNYELNGKYYSQTITLSRENIEEIWNSIKDNMEALADRSDTEPAEELMQVNVQFYKLI